MSDFSLDSYILWLNQHPAWILGSLLLTAFIESLAIAGIIVPGVAILFAVAVVAGGAEIPLLLALAAAMSGAVLGDVLSFYIGRHYSDRLSAIWPFSRFPDAIESGTRFFRKHGGLSVVIGRFVGPIRPILPLVAGALAMPPLRFIAINVLSALAWAPAYVLPGYLVGAAVNISPPAHWPGLLGGLATCLLVAGLFFRHANKQLQEGQGWYDFLHRQGRQGELSGRDKPIASGALLVFSLFGLIIWTQLTLHSSGIALLNTLWLEFAQSFEFAPLRNFFILLTALGDKTFLQISFTIAVLCLLATRQMAAALLMALSGFAINALTHGLKEYFAIPRPDILLQTFPGFAYPSGHSSGAMVFYGLIAALIAERVIPQARWKIYLALGTPAILIALSRMVLGVHWFSDVLAGLLCGTALCGAARLLYWFLRHRTQDLSDRTGLKHPIGYLIGFGCWLLSALLYLVMTWEQQILTYTLAP